MRRIVLLGPPGAGKGTQARELSQELHLAHLSTGDILRANVARRSPLGTEARGYMDAGRLVPDALVLAMLRDRLGQPDAAAGFLLDGFPRTLAQAEALDRFVALDAVISFEIPSTMLKDRLTQRRTCPTCQTVYNISTLPPRRPGLCDKDGSPLITRPDDLPEAVATRLRVYEAETAPLLGYYRSRGRLRSIDASGTPEEVHRHLQRALR